MDVYLGKRKLGTTPFKKVELPPGKHTLRLVNEAAGINRRHAVTIVSGKELPDNVRME